MIDREHVLHIARLARLNLSEIEVESMTIQLGSILDYIDQLNLASIEGVEPTCYVAPAHDPLRDDTEIPSLDTQQILKNGPNIRKGHFAIPKVIGG